MEWINYKGNNILATEFFRDRSESNSNIMFIALQNCLIHSKNGKTKADRNSWIFYSDDIPSFLDEQAEWEIVIYDFKQGDLSVDYYVMIEDIIQRLNRDVYVIVSGTIDVIPIFTEFTGIKLSPSSCLIGGNVGQYSDNALYNSSNIDATIANRGNITGIYPPYDIFPSQPYFIFPNYQALYITVGQPNSGRREFFNTVQNIVEVEKKGNWENKLRKNLSAGYSVVLQAMNQSRSDRIPAINIARELGVPVIILWFSIRGKPYEKVTGEIRPAKIYQNYEQSFQEPLKDEGYVVRIN